MENKGIRVVVCEYSMLTYTDKLVNDEINLTLVSPVQLLIQQYLTDQHTCNITQICSYSTKNLTFVCQVCFYTLHFTHTLESDETGPINIKKNIKNIV